MAQRVLAHKELPVCTAEVIFAREEESLWKNGPGLSERQAIKLVPGPIPAESVRR